MTLPGSVVYDWCEEQMTGQGKSQHKFSSDVGVIRNVAEL